MLSPEAARAGPARDDGLQRLPLLRGVLPGVSGDGRAARRSRKATSRTSPTSATTAANASTRASTRRRTSSASTCRGRWRRSGSARTRNSAGQRSWRSAFTAQRRRRLDASARPSRRWSLLWPFVAGRQPMPGDFYSVISARRDGRQSSASSALFVIVALSVGVVRASRTFDASASTVASAFTRRPVPLKPDAHTRLLRRADAAPSPRQRRGLHERRRSSASPWRRWFHHCTFYGFALCFASTSVAAIYHAVFGWRAPYALLEPAGRARHAWRRRTAASARSVCWR